MSVEPLGIDLNSDGGFGGQEKDVSFDVQMVKKPLLSHQSVVKRRQVVGDHPTVEGLEAERQLKDVGESWDFETRVGSIMEKHFNDHIGAGGGLCLGGSTLGICGYREGVGLKGERIRAAENRASWYVEDEIDINVRPEEDKVSTVHVNKKDRISANIPDGGDDHMLGDYMVIDLTNETSLTSQRIRFNGSREVDAVNLQVNRSGPSGLMVDLNECMSSTDIAISVDTNAESDDASRSAFCISDLVWGKVGSHPWWPGQIFESAAASKMAHKYLRKNTYLIAYFGDQTFAWNEVSRIKHFRAHFSEMECQSGSQDFRYAVHCALKEIARRTEFCLACRCIRKQVYANISTQEVVNAGIRKAVQNRAGGDRFSDATSFRPLQLIEFVKGLARSAQQYDKKVGSVLQLVTYKSQLLAYYRWKGYYEQPQFQAGWLVNAPEISADCKPLSMDSTSTAHKPEGDVSSNKKEKRLSDLMLRAHLKKQSGKIQPGCKSRASSACNSGKRKSSDSRHSDDFSSKHRKSSAAESNAASQMQQSQQGFRVGSSILRAVGQMNRFIPTLKHKASHKYYSPIENVSSAGGEFRSKENGCANEMLSELLSAATEPMKNSYTCSLTFISFFTELRNFAALDGKLNYKAYGHAITQVTLNEMMDIAVMSVADDEKGQMTLNEMIDTAAMSVSDDEKSPPEELLQPIHRESKDEMLEKLASCGSCFGVPDDQKHQQGTTRQSNHVMENISIDQFIRIGRTTPNVSRKEDSYCVDESCNEDPSPTALILNFSDLESIPMEERLNELFSLYGPLNESETQVLTKSKRAKVVFRKRADAEIAFTSAGKYKIFGPSLISYRLKYFPSKPSKASLRKIHEKLKS